MQALTAGEVRDAPAAASATPTCTRARAAALAAVGLGRPRRRRRAPPLARRAAPARDRAGAGRAAARAAARRADGRPLAGRVPAHGAAPAAARSRHHRADHRARHGHRARGRPQVTVLHYGRVIADGPREAGARRPARCGRSTSVPEPVLAVADRPHLLRRQPRAAGRLARRAPTARCVAILGRNGMGKTTLIRSIVGFTPPRAGPRCASRATTSPRGRRSARSSAGMALVPQGRRVFPSLSVRENLEVARGGARALEPRARLRALPAPARARGQPRQQALGRRAADAGHRPRAHEQPRRCC